MKILVIGGAGYIGSHTCYALIEAGHEVVVFDNLSTGFSSFVHKNSKLIKGDIIDKKSLIKVFSSYNFDLVMDFAAKIIVPESVSDPLGYYANNTVGVMNIIDCIKQFKVKSFIFSSSAAVYGDSLTGECDERDACLPINPYGETKLASENLIKWSSSAYGFSYICFRYFNVAGAHSSKKLGVNNKTLSHLIPIIIESGLKLRGKLIIAGNDYPTKDGSCVRDYVHVLDVARAHVLGSEYLYNNGESQVLNIGSNKGYSVLEIVNEINKVIPIEYEFGPRRAGDPAKLLAKSDKIKEVLNFTPEYSVLDMAKSDLAYRKKLNKERLSLL